MVLRNSQQPSRAGGNHALPYSIIGIQCILIGGILFPPIYWQTACLLQRSGTLDGKTSDYNKIAKAVSTLSKQGVNILPVDINKSEKAFTLNAETNSIYFGLDGVKGLKSATIDKIISERPFNSLWDFIVQTGADITSIVTLIKAGAFDKFDSRQSLIDQVAKFKADQKDKLTAQNYMMLSREGFWPTHTEELKLAQRVFNFTQYLKALNYKLDETARVFLAEVGYEVLGNEIEPTAWKYYYDLRLAPMKQYLIDNQQEMLDKVNAAVTQEWKDKYFPNNDIAQWEIETMGICFAEHPLYNVKAGMDDFDDLPQEPEINNIFRTKTGRNVPMYRLTMICGVVIANDKLHSTITLLTAGGPVDVKFRKEQYANYSCQISQTENNKKKIIERSWFNRGNKLIIHGMRVDDYFMAKCYKNSPMKHTAYKILSVSPEGKCEIQKERKKGKAENDDEE